MRKTTHISVAEALNTHVYKTGNVARNKTCISFAYLMVLSIYTSVQVDFNQICLRRHMFRRGSDAASNNYTHMHTTVWITVNDNDWIRVCTL